ncbi:hypothetical protein Taro_003659, partial [Colocasia esculenta]|nr:hypothetical protein [Colocasia esculenta]
VPPISWASTECRGVSQPRPDPKARSEFPGAARHHRLARAGKGADLELGVPGQGGQVQCHHRRCVPSGICLEVDVAGETASLQALLHSAMQDREAAQREAEQLRRVLERVRRAAAAGASSSRVAEGPQSDLEDRLAAVVRRAEETQADLAKRETALRAATDRDTELQGQVDSVAGERDQLRIRAEAAEARVTEVTRELATLRVQGPSVDQEELVRLCADLQAQQTLT